MDKTYYISFSKFGSGSLLSGTIIKGKNGVDALLKHYGKKFKRSADRHVEVVMNECRVENGDPVLCGNTCGYEVVE